MRIRILAVGRGRAKLFDPALEEYRERLSHYCKLEELEIAEAKRASAPEGKKLEEGRNILAKLKQGERLWALDERGTQLGSREFAELLSRSLNSSQDIAICIGGAEGLCDEVRSKADRVLSLSKMTLAHRLAKLVLLEQLYRAFTILRGEPYHR